MYNRYIPQPDGTYRRNFVPDPQVCPQSPGPKPPPAKHEETDCLPQKQEVAPCPPEPQQPCHTHSIQQENGIGGFLQRLLPKNFDTGDLIVVLLLLLMASESKEDQNTALLTLALYFFM
jgi:hypothetical protein